MERKEKKRKEELEENRKEEMEERKREQELEERKKQEELEGRKRKEELNREQTSCVSSQCTALNRQSHDSQHCPKKSMVRKFLFCLEHTTHLLFFLT